MKRSRLIIYSISLCLLLFVLARLYYRLTDDFRFGNIIYDGIKELPIATPSAPTPHEQEQLAHILNQNFYYLGKGAQCYAFVSEDQQYVLKFFKFKHLRPSRFVDWLPSLPLLDQYKQQVAERKKKKLYSIFVGYELAYRENKAGSELLYMHLLPTNNIIRQKVTVTDKIGLHKTINLDDVVFLLQKKGETLKVRLHRQLEQDQVEDAKSSLAQIIAMYVGEYRKGIYDRDHGVMHNTGFVEDHPFHLDVGKLTKDNSMRESAIYKQDLSIIVWKMGLWVHNHYPQYFPLLAAYLADQYYQQTGELINMDNIDRKIIKKKKSAWKMPF